MTSKPSNGVAKAPATETTPLIAKSDEENAEKTKTSLLSPIYRVLLCGFLVSLSFGVTQVPLVYVFRVMSCDAFYTENPNHPGPPPPTHDRCSLPAIESATARAVSLLGCSTTFFGVANLFITGRLIKRFGVRSSLALNVFWPAARLAVQNVGVMLGGANGIVIVQLSQLLTIVGGPVGYLLALNTYVSETTSNAERTGYLGRLQGYAMFGSAVGMFAGGMLAEAFGILAPFQVTLTLFLLCSVYVLVVLPYVPPEGASKEEVKGSALARAIGPLRVLAPRKWVLSDGRVRREYGAIVLSVGVFLAVLATGYIPVLLQMYATDIFEFGTRENSYLVSSHGLLRGLFLVFAFPRIIDIGRKFVDKDKSAKQPASTQPATSSSEAPTTVAETDGGRLTGVPGISGPMQEEEDPDTLPPKPKTAPQQQTYDFDLLFTRYSLLIDGLLTLLASFITHGYQMYILSAVLPLGAGTAASAKGVILQMSSPTERTDALSAISLVEMVARLMTTFLFGLVFAAFAGVGKTWLVFVCNAAVALVGFGVLLFSRFPPDGAVRVEVGKALDDDDEEEVTH